MNLRSWILFIVLGLHCSVPTWGSRKAEGDQVPEPESRIALVVGKDNHVDAAPKKNPDNDARDMCASLEKLGFEVICKFDIASNDGTGRNGTFTKKLLSQQTLLWKKRAGLDLLRQGLESVESRTGELRRRQAEVERRGLDKLHAEIKASTQEFKEPEAVRPSLLREQEEVEQLRKNLALQQAKTEAADEEIATRAIKPPPEKSTPPVNGRTLITSRTDHFERRETELAFATEPAFADPMADGQYLIGEIGEIGVSYPIFTNPSGYGGAGAAPGYRTQTIETESNAGALRDSRVLRDVRAGLVLSLNYTL